MDHRILVIDGHPVYIKKTEGFLKGMTITDVELSATGKEGLERLDKEEFDLVILSGILPDMSSFKVCETVRSKCPAVKIIVQVGLFCEMEDRDNFLKCGADVVLDRKEKDLAPLESALTRLLGVNSNAAQ
ncbi:MAG: response regulator [Candidatus Omnitrophica bacterium]|nr:response regulator [Candidatus Omnitrophota bacterium]